ncbi:acetyl-CoA carboxylase biotin carboxyl carrier protein [Actinopolyspora mortivallis]|uniref:acetyl-CoA carboxylase biotin carboxyl carrier protein n=1 Tax=Actinopolyspora mortivallis TaxID=33906 RepID=UPI000362305C|nr:biotin/lipoyl-containing protein [Actinopolyspora mortivallis]
MSIETNGAKLTEHGQDLTTGTPNTSGAGHHTIAELGEHVGRLLARVDRPVRRIRLQAGPDSVEIDWADEPGPAPAVDAAGAVEISEAVGEEGTRTAVRAPLVGTFYRAPAPGEDPFVEIGTIVEQGQQLAIIEAMKLMNPISAPVSGRVVSITGTEAELVEYDQVLFEIEPEEE